MIQLRTCTATAGEVQHPEGLSEGLHPGSAVSHQHNNAAWPCQVLEGKGKPQHPGSHHRSCIVEAAVHPADTGARVRSCPVQAASMMGYASESQAHAEVSMIGDAL